MDKGICEGCEYREPRQNGWCYMFKNEPPYCFKNKDKEIDRLRKALEDINADDIETRDEAIDIAQQALKENSNRKKDKV